MTQKHHQEEISGPSDTIEAAPLAKDLSRPKRARIQSRKALENQVHSQSERTTVATQPINVQNSPVLDSLQSSETYEKQRQLPNSQNSSKGNTISSQRREKKEEWQ